MKLLLLVLALPNFLWAQWNVAIEGGANYIPITFSEFRTFTGKALIEQTVLPTGITQLTTNHLSNGTYLVKINKNGIPCFTTFVIINHEK